MRGIVRGVMMAAPMLGALMSSRGAAAAVQIEWALPFANVAPGLVAVGDGAVYFTDFDGQSGTTQLGTLDPDKGNINEMRLPYFSVADLGVRPCDGALFLADIDTSELALADTHHRELRRWAMPPLAVGGPRSFTFDEQGRVLFLVSSFIERTAVGRLDTRTNVVEFWQVPDSIGAVDLDIAWRLVRAADGSVFFNMNGFTHNQLVRLDMDTGVFTSWQLAAQPVFGLATDGTSVYFQEIASGVRNVARLVPATGTLTEWSFDPTGEFGQNLVFEGGRLYFGVSFPPGLGALNPASPGAESMVAPVAADAVAPLSFSLSPVVTRHHAHARKGRSKPATTAPAATAVGSFVLWSTGDTNNWVAGDGAGTIYFSGGSQGTAIARFVP